MTDPYDLPFPDDRWPPGRPAYVIVVDQLRDWQPGQPPSLAELLETRARPHPPTRTRPGSRTMTLTPDHQRHHHDQRPDPHTARQAPGGQHLWQVSWLPGRVLTATAPSPPWSSPTAATGVHDLNERHRLWPHIESWAAELGLTGPDAVARASQPAAETSSRRQPEQDGGRLDPEAAE